MHEILNKKGFLCDMDGVIYHGNKILDGVKEFVNFMLENDKKFVFLMFLFSTRFRQVLFQAKHNKP